MAKAQSTTARQNAEKLNRLKTLLKGKRSMLIVMQDYPDPDAIASAVGLRTLVNAMAGLPCSLAHGGTIARAENRALSRYLKLSLRAIETLDATRFDLIAMVDAQPETGNTSLAENQLPHIVIDHHPIRRVTRRSAFTDVRSKYGATSTILHEYLVRAGVEIKLDLATALLYGIRSDTQDLGRETHQADIDAYLALYPLANKRMLSRIENASLSDSYFQLFAKALASATVHGSAVLASVGDTDNPDMIGEVADLLIRRKHTDHVICYGYHAGKALFSIRLAARDMNAGLVARRVAGRRGTAGGHNGFAGGQIPLANDDSIKERMEVDRAITERFKKAVAATGSAERKLVS